MGKEKMIDLAEMRFGYLTVLERDYSKIKGGTYWLCRCDCGKIKSLARSNLIRGTVHSCGCMKGELIHNAKKSNLTGKRFGRLTVFSPRSHSSNDDGSYWICRCDCGNTTTVTAKNLLNGNTKSCGCLARDSAIKRNRDNAIHNCSRERLYAVWQNIKNRCNSPRNHAYGDYGGRGISVCEEWATDYLAFRDWAYANGYDENAPRGQCTLDRIDVNGNYEPSNCRWVDLFAQANNKRNSTHISINGESKTLSEWCRIYGTNPSRVRARMNSGWDLERAITTPIRKINKYE